jgi:hypothetical protein
LGYDLSMKDWHVGRHQRTTRGIGRRPKAPLCTQADFALIDRTGSLGDHFIVALVPSFVLCRQPAFDGDVAARAIAGGLRRTPQRCAYTSRAAGVCPRCRGLRVPSGRPYAASASTRADSPSASSTMTHQIGGSLSSARWHRRAPSSRRCRPQGRVAAGASARRTQKARKW